MSTSTDNDPNKPAIGYPYPPPPTAQSTYNHHHHHHPNGGYPPPPPAHSNYHQSTTGTGYPYTAPPPATYYNSNPYPPAHSYDPRRATFIRRLLIVMISAFILFGIITFIVWLVMRPRLPEFRVDSASVSGFNTSSSLSANWDVSFFVRNPNSKMSVYYDRLDGSVYYRREFLSETQIAPFSQGTKTQTTVRVKLAASETYLDARSINQIAGERTSGTVNFNLRLLGWVKFRSGTWRTRIHLMRVVCENVSIGFKANSGAGTLLGGPKRCGVDL